MASKRSRGPAQHKFHDKLVLNQWLISLFGIDPLSEEFSHGKIRPFHKLADPIRDKHCEGTGTDNLHLFYYHLGNCPLLRDADLDGSLPGFRINGDLLLKYEQNIVMHTATINAKRAAGIKWKYYQWLSLLFSEIYLDRYFADREGLLRDLNVFVKKFNQHWADYADVPPYTLDDLNKLCFQNATGSGKTLIMHVNLLQYQDYAKKYGKEKELSRIILLTPNERLSSQHLEELRASGILARKYVQSRGLLEYDSKRYVEVLEITKLGEQEGPNTVAVRSLGNQNLLFVDEGHRGMSGKEEGAWFTRRSELSEKGFTFEYSATFEQAVQASGSVEFGNSYAKAVLFDYSYRWFYEDGFGKDYQILNLPASYEEVELSYLTACLLKFHQQLHMYETYKHTMKGFHSFNLEKPLWVFVGTTVAAQNKDKDSKSTISDVAKIISFIADFLNRGTVYIQRIAKILEGGRDVGLVDSNGREIFAQSFTWLAERFKLNAEEIYHDILAHLFNSASGGRLRLERIKGDSGEVLLRAGNAMEPFGLINVGDAKSLCDHISEVAMRENFALSVEDSDFSEAIFDSVKESSSPVNLLIGSKKFVEGWDCWRVSTMGLMHVGRSEGAQIIQLFGRGVRLRGKGNSLRRGSDTKVKELETLNVFGIQADFMEKFRDFLDQEGLPGNEQRTVIEVPLNVIDHFGKKLMILRPKRKGAGGEEYSFKKDGPVPTLERVPEKLQGGQIVVDWYPRIQVMASRGIFGNNTLDGSGKETFAGLSELLPLLDFDALFFELERVKRDCGWYNLNISKDGIRALLEDKSWYKLYLPKHLQEPSSYADICILQQVAAELLRKFADSYYKYCSREYIEPRLELYELSKDDENIPEDKFYHIIVDGDEAQIVEGVKKLAEEIKSAKKVKGPQGLEGIRLGIHLYEPLFHVEKGKISIQPVVLNKSEFEFVSTLQKWHEEKKFQEKGIDIFLLRNLSRGKGIGFFEAEGFYPDFILWTLIAGKQYVSFIDPHGLEHEGIGNKKIQFCKGIKKIEERLDNKNVVLNSFILSCTPMSMLRKWNVSKEYLEKHHVLFMDDSAYLDKLFAQIVPELFSK